MALTKDDLHQIKLIVSGEVSGLKSDVSGLKEGLSGLKSDLDRMEGRLTTAINLLQRDTFTRLDDHDARIARLEKAISP